MIAIRRLLDLGEKREKTPYLLLKEEETIEKKGSAGAVELNVI